MHSAFTSHSGSQTRVGTDTGNKIIIIIIIINNNNNDNNDDDDDDNDSDNDNNLQYAYSSTTCRCHYKAVATLYGISNLRKKISPSINENETGH